MRRSTAPRLTRHLGMNPTLALADENDQARTRTLREQAPLAIPALALAAGVIADRHLVAISTLGWLGLVFGALGVASVGIWIRAERLTRVALLVGTLAVGGGWHHARWSDLPGDDLARFAWDRTAPAWVRGTLVEEPTFYPPDPATGLSEGYTRLIVALHGRSDGREWQACSGRLLASVTGDVADMLRMGERLRLAGTIRPMEGPSNPGEADLRERWRAEGVRLRMSVKGASAIGAEEGRRDFWLGLLGDCRVRSAALLTENLPEDVAPLAAALLLGRREALDPEVNEAFAHTGTTHWLAISGLHMQALALLVGYLLSRTVLGLRGAAVVVLIATIAYTILVGGSPSVVRSAAMTTVICLAVVLQRQTVPGNLLALAGMVLVVINPSSLFDLGAQLSFLSVAGLAWGVPALTRAIAGEAFAARPEPSSLTPKEALDRLERELAPAWRKRARGLGLGVAVALATSVLLFAIGLPLTLHRFHLVPFVAIPLNLVLVPLSMPALASSLVVLITSAIAPWMAGPAGWVSGQVLRLAQSLVAWGANVPGGHVFAGGPPAWWVLAFYVALTATLRPKWRRAGVGGLAGCVLAGVFLALSPRVPSTLEAEVLDVDHGLAVLVRAPSGRTLLYDCGRMRDPRVGQRIVAPALWAAGVSRIDTLILSHADLDHFSGVPDLLQRVRVGEVRVPPGFGGNGDRAARGVLAACERWGVPVRPIGAGESIDVGPNVTARVLHPPLAWRAVDSDNAGSVVIEVGMGGRSLLLTGDLDGAGIDALLETEAPAVDAMLAPHHGGRSANPARLYAWADPKVVLVSQNLPEGDPIPELTALVEEGRDVRFTGGEGAIRLRWTEARIVVDGYSDVAEDDDPPSIVPAGLGAFSPWLLGVLALGVGLGACVGMAVVEWGAWALVAPGRRIGSGEVEPPPWELIGVETQDGARLVGALWTQSEGKRGLAVLLHGYAEDRSALLGRARALADRGWSVAVLDSRARGRSGGQFCTFGALESHDLREWLNLRCLQPRGGKRVVVWGRSMGAAIALGAAVIDSRIGALVLEAPYAELAQPVSDGLRRTRLPAFLTGWMLGRASRIARVSLDRPRPIELAPAVSVPVLIVHGELDPVAPPKEVERLAAAFATKPLRIEVAGAKHVDVFDVGGEALAEQIAAFLSAGDESVGASR